MVPLLKIAVTTRSSRPTLDAMGGKQGYSGASGEVRYPKFRDLLRAGMAKKQLEIRHIKEALGVEYEMARRYYHGMAMPRHERMTKLIELVGIDPKELLQIEGATRVVGVSESEREYEGGTVTVAESTVTFSAGPGHEPILEIEEHGEPARYRADWLRQEGIKPTNAFRCRVRGNSMEPAIPDGAIILVDTGFTQITEDQIYAIRYGSELRVKRLNLRLDGSLVLISENAEEYPPEIVPPDRVQEQISVIGRVAEAVKTFSLRRR